MSATLSPLPSPNPEFAPRAASPRVWNVLPFPFPKDPPAARPAPAPLPAWPLAPASGSTAFPSSWPSPLTVLPAPPSSPGDRLWDKTVPPAPSDPPALQAEPTVLPPSPPPQRPLVIEPDFTDDDLGQAFGPIVEKAVRNAVYAKENGIDTHLEPMLRATIRRALAEYSPASRPFQPPGTLDRFIWHVQALFTSRTYEDILFEKTRRFQVDEVFLLDPSTLALISFASCDPARHASVRRVTGTVQRLALQLRDAEGKIRPVFELPDLRSVISRQGRHVILMALVRGRPGELVYADLDFALRRVEDHFRDQFQQEGSDLLYVLQPFLEDCLLIQAPASAA